MRIIMKLAGLLVLCLPAAAMTQQAEPDSRWTSVVQSEKGRIFLDRSTLQREGNLRTILVRAIPAAVYQEMASAEVSMRFDCTGRRYAMLRVKAFRSDGSELTTTEMPNGMLEPVGQEPDTVALLERVCAL